MPESFKVLVKEMRSLCLNIELEGHDMKPIDVIEEHEEEPQETTLFGAIDTETKRPEADADAEALDLLSAGIDDMIESLDSLEIGNDLIGEGEDL